MERAEAITEAAPQARDEKRWLALVREWALPLAVAAFVLEAALFAITGRINQDEGWYLLAGRLVYEGKVLYRDFPYFQSPLLPYVFGLPQALMGESLIVGRATGFAFACTTCAAVAYSARLLSGRWAAVWAIGLLLVTPEFMLASTTARSEAPVIALTLLALLCALRWPDGMRGLMLAPLLLLLASGIRLTSFPLCIAMFAYTCWRSQPSPGQAMLGGALLLFGAIAMYGPFIAADPDATYFNIVTSQADRAKQLADFQTPVSVTFLQRTFSLSLNWITFLVIGVPTTATFAYMIGRYIDGWRPGRPGAGAEPLTNYTLIMGMAFIAWAPAILLERQEGRYFVASYALLAIMVADVMVRSHRAQFGEAGRYVLLPIVPLIAAVAMFNNGAQAAGLLNVRHPDIFEINDAADYIRPLLDEDGGGLVTLDGTLVIATQADVPAELTMGYFSYWPSLPEEDLERYRLVNRRRLEALMHAPETRVIAIDDFNLQTTAIGSTAEDYDFAAPEPPFAVFPDLRAEYDIVRTFERYGQLQDTLYILKRK